MLQIAGRSTAQAAVPLWSFEDTATFVDAAAVVALFPAARPAAVAPFRAAVVASFPASYQCYQSHSPATLRFRSLESTPTDGQVETHSTG